MADPKYAHVFQSGRSFVASECYGDWRRRLRAARAVKAAKLAGKGVAKALTWVAKKSPVFGIVAGAVLWPSDVQAKGPIGGTLNTILDGIPVVGTVKGVIELGTGDLIPDLADEMYYDSEEMNLYEMTNGSAGSTGQGGSSSSYDPFPGASRIESSPPE